MPPKPTFKAHESKRPKNAWATRVVTAAHGRTRPTLREAWVESVVGDQWMAAYRLVPGLHREPVIAEIRIFPRERTKGRLPGRWSVEALGLDANIPEGGLSAEVVRQVRIGEHRQVGAAFSQWLGEEQTTVQPTFGGQMAPPAQTPKRGRPPTRSETFYAKLAQAYAERVANGSPRPTADVARRRRLPATKVRDMLHQARQLGLLSSAGRGRRGGELTPKALAVLSAANQ